jgi:hypothetical protein
MGKNYEHIKNYKYGDHCLQGGPECDRAKEAAGTQGMPSTHDMGPLKAETSPSGGPSEPKTPLPAGL